MDFGCGAVDMAASDCVGGPTGRSNEGSVTTTLGFIISLVFLIRHHFFWTHSHQPSLCRICQILLWPHFLVSTGATLRPDLAWIPFTTTREGGGFPFLSWYLLFRCFFLTEARMMLEAGITWGSSDSDFTGITVLVLLEFNFSFGDANSSGVLLCSKIAIQGLRLISSILLAYLTAASTVPFPFGLCGEDV